MQSLFRLSRLLVLGVLVSAAQASTADVWASSAFAADPATLIQAAQVIPAREHSEATIVLNDLHLCLDERGRLEETLHQIYRIENEQGVENWAEISGRWEAWHQARPEIKARVINTDATVHWLDPNTLTEMPVHENTSDVYSDEHKYGGPLPAVAVGALVEEEVVIRDTAPAFAAGNVYRWRLVWDVPVHKTHVVLSHPIFLPLNYEIHLLPEAKISKSTENGSESISIDQDALPAYTEQIDHVPPDVVLFPEIEVSSGTSWRMVASEYARLSEKKISPSEIQALTAKGGVKTDRGRDDVIRRLLATLHENVRYTGVEFGESSLVPQAPSETLKRKYGDCKDKATLLVAMLRSAGISANLALLDTGPSRDINTNLPGMGMFDHVIVYVPASGRDSELWIDATDQYSQLGTLPRMDYGRWVLVVSESTDSLRRTPEITSAQNDNREFRDFALSEYGPARIVETDDAIGPEDANYRAYYGADSKQVREESERYIKDIYLADSLISLDHSDLSDLTKPATIKFVSKGKRGNTDLTAARVTMTTESLFDRLPKYFRTETASDSSEADESEQTTPRTVDWWISPFRTEWRYKITAPLGFTLRTLPPDTTLQLGTLSLTQTYSTNSNRTVVEALLRLENAHSRITVQQAKQLREAVLKARKADPIGILFDHIGHSLIAAGKVSEGLTVYRQVVAQHPTEALHQVQLAQALLSAGLGEQARTIAQEATALEPDSTLAFTTLGMVLSHDLIGRRLKKGMDYDGAVAAYERALALNAKDEQSRADLALLLEYNPDGIRYGENARLTEAVRQFRELKRMDEEYGCRFDDNILYDLWYERNYQEVLEYASTLPTNDTRVALRLAAIAVQQGSESALKASLEITTDDETRGKALIAAGDALVRVHKYAEGAAMFAEGAHKQHNESELVRSSAILSKVRPYREFEMDPADPRSVVQKFLGDMLSGRLTVDEEKSLFYSGSREKQGPAEIENLRQMNSILQSHLGHTGLPRVTVADVALSNMHYSVEGKDSFGYKVTIETPGDEAQDVYVVRDGTSYKIAGFTAFATALSDNLGSLALREIAKSNLTSARKWLDRARNTIHIYASDDPLDGQPFAYFWTKGQKADAATMRTAALLLLLPEKVNTPYLIDLDKARVAAKTELDRGRLTMQLAYAHSAQKHWAEMLPLAEELTRSFPTSVRAFEIAVVAYSRLHRFDRWERLVNRRMREQPDEVAYIRSAAQLAAYRRQFPKSREIIKSLIDKGQATANDYNLYAWYALFIPHPIEQDTIDAALRANDLTNNANFAMLQTLACVYAAAGNTSQSRELLMKAMDSVYLDEPNSEVWFGLGLIAEQDGEFVAAAQMFDRVESPDLDTPGTPYALAQQHLAALGITSIDSAKIARR